MKLDDLKDQKSIKFFRGCGLRGAWCGVFRATDDS